MNNIQSEQDIIELIKNDQLMMEILTLVKDLRLPDCWVCAGFIRSKVWDVLHGFKVATPLEDVDVVYFDSKNIDSSTEKKFEEKLRHMNPNINWSVKNQARMNIRNNDSPYKSSEDAISKFPETATAVGVQLDSENNVILTCPCGIEDLINLIVRPTEHFIRNADTKAEIYEERLQKKNWQEKWYKLNIIHML
ncbi:MULTISPECIES: nucleotidyltransferase family protein [Aneurinibacillus]|uniref:Nucleotidyltransferase family protein n=1 Tax=Aneurinibacillus thermoaerophilus TaxID=143495 RepID=A0A1G8BM35_ANETH|nr:MULTISPECIES: nucleotidyltransferase family protein [Aneurinibacillus]AMA73400.1 hypothetical protein ACH33_11410 [Aneurinibacillus sp. XH2]MED0676064.1 nucleotidyltransferase family protein [Aneurinibacillus thermoaerophilus]MED0681123.1 nucleotidyltransferase family protein [Aneurinibacillus thermoaerophilus]MED0736348.1 nucleotidyltransferase family protein [Aneurinibacillus thermoaerophilus]MED0758433.1 nucleotidyltransferase family protein [Aneurinibacillus thermoaerophilus]